MEILIISGLSGSGKSRAAAFLEDIGYYIVDNLPAEMMLKFANFCESGGRAKTFSQNEQVQVNGETCVQRGKKLRPGDTVRFLGNTWKVTQEAL